MRISPLRAYFVFGNIELSHSIPPLCSTVVEAKGSHAIYFSQPKAVAALIEQAASKDKGTAVA